MTPEDLISALGTVPETKLIIFDLLPGLVDNGLVNPEKVLAQQAQVEQATKQASHYADGTRRVTCSLIDLF